MEKLKSNMQMSKTQPIAERNRNGSFTSTNKVNGETLIQF
jgi:hypothetical protein